MNYSTNYFVQELLIHTPIIIVCCLGICFALLFGSRTPKASLWALGAYALTLFLVFYVALDGSGFSRFQFIALRAGSYGMLLIAVFAGRPDPVGPHDKSQGTLWQLLMASLRACPSAKVVFVLLFLFFFLANTIVTIMSPPVFESTARIRVKQDRSDISGLSGQQSSQSTSYDPYFLRTEAEVIQSEAILSQIVTNAMYSAADGQILFQFRGRGTGKPAALKEVWSEQAPRSLTTQECMLMLRNRLRVLPIPNSSLIEIRVASWDGGETAEIANAVARVYANYRINELQRLTADRVEALTKRLADLQKRVEATQKTADVLQRELEVPSSLVLSEVAQRNLAPEERDLSVATQKAVASQNAIRWRPFFDANRQLRELDRVREALTAKLEFEITDLKMPKTSLVSIVDSAHRPLRPASPNPPATILLGAVAGLLLASAAALIVSFYRPGAKQQPTVPEVGSLEAAQKA